MGRPKGETGGGDTMLRKMGAMTGAAALVLVLSAQPLSATTSVPLPSGNVTCAMTGTMKFSKFYPNASSDTGALRNVHIKIAATMSNCNTAGVTGGKAPIIGGTLTITGILEPGSSCSDISDGSAPDFTFDNNKLQVTWKGVDGRSHPTVGKSKTDIFSTGNFLFGGWEYDGDTFGDNDAFAGESAVIDLGLDASSQNLVNECINGASTSSGPVNLTQVNFGGVSSKITVTP
jgi:hypothetical protein